MQKRYPDISGILSAKARRRKALAALSWEEKVAIIERMQKLLPKGKWKIHAVFHVHPIGDTETFTPSIVSSTESFSRTASSSVGMNRAIATASSPRFFA